MPGRRWRDLPVTLFDADHRAVGPLALDTVAPEPVDHGLTVVDVEARALAPRVLARRRRRRVQKSPRRQRVATGARDAGDGAVGTPERTP